MGKEERIRNGLRKARDISAIEGVRTDEAIEQLKKDYVSGKMTEDEFDERIYQYICKKRGS